ncbi:hypothetical protein [Nostoc sp.]|uniref:hypothetical protein n=1 Tax=Nostoc sp. TaxID=1180 RepID=UPI002FF4B45C
MNHNPFQINLLGNLYDLSEVEDIRWDNPDGTESSGVDYPEYAHSYYGDAETFYISLVDGTQLEVAISDLDHTTEHLLYEWIDTL